MGAVVSTAGSVQNFVASRRAKQKLSQTALVQLVGVTRETISNIERDLHVPSLLIALRIARALQVAVEEIFHLDEPRPV